MERYGHTTPPSVSPACFPQQPCAFRIRPNALPPPHRPSEKTKKCLNIAALLPYIALKLWEFDLWKCDGHESPAVVGCFMVYHIAKIKILFIFSFLLYFLYFFFSYHSIFLQNQTLQLKIPLLATYSLFIALLSQTLHHYWHWHPSFTTLKVTYTGYIDRKQLHSTYYM